jgi:hypothetical protein
MYLVTFFSFILNSIFLLTGLGNQMNFKALKTSKTYQYFLHMLRWFLNVSAALLKRKNKY